MLTIKDKLFNFIKPFFSNQLSVYALNEVIKSQHALNKERAERKQISEVMELEVFIGKPVICISNEWETPIIGIATQIDFITKGQNPILCVHNYLDNKDYTVFGKTFLFTEQRFNALFKLDPFELCSFIYTHTSKEFIKNRIGQLLTKEEVIDILDSSGFYKEAKLRSPLKPKII